MASKEISQSEFIVEAVAEVTRAAIQTMAVASTSRQDNAGLKMNGSKMKQPMSNWSTKTSMKSYETSN